MSRLIDADALKRKFDTDSTHFKTNPCIRATIDEATTVPQWIKINSLEDLPPKATDILAFDANDGYMREGHSSWLYKSPCGEIRMPARHGKGMCVTHWQPLPEPPDGETQ